MKLRDFVKDKITVAEELVQYKEFTSTIQVISTNMTLGRSLPQQFQFVQNDGNGSIVLAEGCNVNITETNNYGNNQLSQTASLKRIQKFILHNGQERIICEEPKTVFFNGPITVQGCNFFEAGNSESRIFTPLNNALSSIEPILDIIPQITSYKSSNASYISQNASLTQNINSVKQRTIDFQTQASKLQSQVNSFQISDTIKTLNAKQKAHILQKTWGSSDEDSTGIINAVKQSGFDPHYVNKSGQSLLTLAFSKNDAALFDLLIANKMDFNSCIDSKSAFQLVLATNNAVLTSKMFATNQDFSKSILDIALNNDAAMLEKIFSHKEELSKVSYSGYSLLQLTLKKGNYEAAEEILKVATDSITQLSSNGLSSLQLCLLWNNKEGVELLKKYGANIEEELNTAIDKKYSNIINKILDTEPALIKNIVNLETNKITEALLQNSRLLDVTDGDGNNLLHLACKAENYALASKILDNNSSCINQQNKAGKTAFHTLLESSLESSAKAQFAELLLKYHPDINLSDTQHHTITDLATEYEPNILTMLYEQNLIGEADFSEF